MFRRAALEPPRTVCMPVTAAGWLTRRGASAARRRIRGADQFYSDDENFQSCSSSSLVHIRDVRVVPASQEAATFQTSKNARRLLNLFTNNTQTKYKNKICQKNKNHGNKNKIYKKLLCPISTEKIINFHRISMDSVRI